MPINLTRYVTDVSAKWELTNVCRNYLCLSHGETDENEIVLILEDENL